MDGFGSVAGSRAWEKLTSLGVPVSYQPGQVLMRQGERTEKIQLLLAGRVKVSLADSAGRSLLLAIRGPGEVLGEIALIDGRTHSATVEALDGCQIRMVAMGTFLTTLRDLGLERTLVCFSIQRLRESEARRLELATLQAGPRVVRGLLHLAVPAVPGDRTVDIGLSQTELGEAIGLSRASVSGKLAELRSAGIVMTRRGRIVITDLARLRDLASE